MLATTVVTLLSSLAAVPVIPDTDMAFDVDDVGALCLLHALQDLGEADLLAVVHNVGYAAAIGVGMWW